jgi:hypothetical protein
MAELPALTCPVCGEPLNVRLVQSKRGMLSLMLVCPEEGRHFRAFLNDQDYIAEVTSRVDRLWERLSRVVRR